MLKPSWAIITSVALTLSFAAYAAYVRRNRRRHLIQRLCKLLPKVELHAHLHGCARLSTIAALAPANVDTSALRVGVDDDRSLSACFAIFAAIHKTVTNLPAVQRIAREVLADFAADNVRYLELRTTPRPLQDAGTEEYVRAVLAELASHEARCPTMTVRLLLSIDRTGSMERALETVMLAAKLRGEEGSPGAKYIVGIDFSGNPTKGSFADFLPAFEVARRQCGLRVAVHAGEVDNPSDNDSILRFRPDRLGHALLLSDANFASLQANPVPIEICPTSNRMTLKLRSLRDHPTMDVLLKADYPISVSTDDSTVFGTTSSKELALAAEACELTPDQIVALASAPLAHAFEPDESGVIAQLHQEFKRASAQALQDCC